MTIISFL